MGHIARLWWAEARAIPQDVLRSRKSTDSNDAKISKVDPLVTAVLRAKILKLTRL